MIRSIGTADLSEAVVTEIADRSDGVPLFVEELSASARGCSRRSRPACWFPATLRELLMSRLEAAGPDIGVAQAAAVIGSRIDVDLLKDVAADRSRSNLRRELDSLTAHGILETQGVGSERRYAFRHSLMRDAAYESQLADAARINALRRRRRT